MAHILQINDVLKVTAIATRGDQTALNSIYYRVDTVTTTGPSDVDAAAAFDFQVGAAFRAWLTDTARYYGMMVQKVFPLPVTVHVINQTGFGNGTAGATPVPGEVSGLVSLKTALAGRAFRGRVYPPFPDRTNFDSTQVFLTGGGQTLLGLYAVGLIVGTTVTGGGGSVHLDPVIFHRKANKAGTTTPNSTTDIAFVVPELELAGQKRRGPRGQPNNPPV